MMVAAHLLSLLSNIINQKRKVMKRKPKVFFFENVATVWIIGPNIERDIVQK